MGGKKRQKQMEELDDEADDDEWIADISYAETVDLLSEFLSERNIGQPEESC